MSSNVPKVMWSNFATIAAVIAAAFAKKGLSASWRLATGKKPPTNPANPDTDIKEAVLWAAVSGMIFAITRMLATRRAASYMRRSKAPTA
jgi:hypothetical protein